MCASTFEHVEDLRNIKKSCTGDIHVTEIRTRCWGRAGALLQSALSLGRIALSVPRGLVSAAEL